MARGSDLLANGMPPALAVLLGNTSYSGPQVPISGPVSIDQSAGGTIQVLTGSTQFTVTVGPTAGFPSGFAVTWVNASTRGITMAITGYSNFFLFPGQTLAIYNDTLSGAWRLFPATKQRWCSPAQTVYLNPSGSNSNDGLATGSANAFATLDFAWNFIKQNIDMCGFGATISCDHGTYNISSAPILPGGYVGNHDVFITGDVTTPSNVVFSISNGANILITDFAIAILSGIEFTSTSGYHIVMNNMAQGDISNCLFGTVAAGGFSSMLLYGGAKLTITGANQFNLGTNGAAWLYQRGVSYADVGVGGTCLGAMAFSKGFYWLEGPAELQLDSVTYTGTGSGAGSTGNTVNATYNAVATGVGASTGIPGAAGSTTSNGGWIIS